MGRKQKLLRNAKASKKEASNKENAKDDDSGATVFIKDHNYLVSSPIFLKLMADSSNKDTPTPDVIEIESKWKIASALHGCIHSMNSLGCNYGKLQKSEFHLATPWLLESSIRGSEHGLLFLSTMSYFNAKPKPEALQIYWHRISKKFNKDNSIKKNTRQIRRSRRQQCEVISSSLHLKSYDTN